MSVFDYTIELWTTIFGLDFATENSTLISDLSVITVLLMVTVFVVALCSIVKVIVNTCSPLR